MRLMKVSGSQRVCVKATWSDSSRGSPRLIHPLPLQYKDFSVIVTDDFCLKLGYFGTIANLTGGLRYQSPEIIDNNDRETVSSQLIFSISVPMMTNAL